MIHTSSSTAAAYIRVSTEDQTEFSPDSQLKRIQEYASHRGICIPEEYIFVDEGISGRAADNRPAFLSMIQTARQIPHPFCLILVWKFSRFARNRQDSIFYKSMLRKECGIDVISVTEQLSDDPTSILIEALLEAMDEYYSINLAQEVRRGMNEKFSRGGVVGIPPFGYRMGADRYETDPETAPILQQIFSDFLEGQSCVQIAAGLNRQNILTRRGNPFQGRTIKYILTNPFYAGFQRRHMTDAPPENPMTIVRGTHPPLISEELFLQIQRKIHSASGRAPANSRRVSAGFALQGLVRCSCCGAVLTQSVKGVSLQCCRYARGKCPQSHSISIKKLETAVLKQLSLDIPADLSLTLPQQKTDRGNFPVRSDIFSFSHILSLLKDTSFPEAAKNRLLRSFILEIIFSRKEGTIKICYRI